MEQLKKSVETMLATFETFKSENDKFKSEMEKGRTDPVLAEKVDKINAAITDESKHIATLKSQVEAVEKAQAIAQFPGGSLSTRDKSKVEHKAAFDKWFRKGIDDNLHALSVQASASTLSDPDGGFTVPEEVDAAIDRVALTVSAMRRLCSVRSISTDTYRKLVNVGGASSGWVAEKGARAETDTPTLKEIAINTKEIYAMPAATQALLDDSAVDIAGWLADEVSIEFNEQEADAFIRGNGVEKPKGISAYTMVANASYSWGKVGYIAGGHASLLNDMDKIIDIQHALKAVYRNGASWLMNDLTLATIRKFKDGDGVYIWRPGLDAGAPDTILGKPVEIDDNVDSIGAGKYPVFFGNFKRAYLVIDRLGTRVLRDPYTSKPFVLFYTTKRIGGGLVMPEAMKVLKIAAS